MVSVTYRTRKVKQPYGGYLPVKQFKKIEYEDTDQLNNVNDEFVSPSVIGLAVDYLTRISLGYGKEEIFEISLRGAMLIKEPHTALDLLEGINSLDNESVINTCKLVGFDSVYRAGRMAYKPVKDINPSEKSIEDIRTLVNRSVRFFNNNGPVLLSGFTFEGGYSSTINSGDADFLTRNTVWDMKVSKNTISSKHTLQLLVYYIMGLKSKHRDHFKQLESIGIYNPKLNTAYVKNINEISKEIYNSISDDVICY